MKSQTFRRFTANNFLIPEHMPKIPRLPTLGKLPDYEPDFEPIGFWLMRPVWWRATCSHVLCGDPSAGKTTFVHSGLHELASMGMYEFDHLKKFPAVRKTKKVSRFSLERNGPLPMVDSWIDADGESFLKCFGLSDSAEQNHRALDKIYDRVNSMILLLPAQRLLDLHRHIDGRNAAAAEVAADYIDGIVKRHRALRPHVGRKFKRKGFRWHLIVSQCGDVALTPRGFDALSKALRHFAERTGLRSSCRQAILMDSIPDPLIKRRIPVATLERGQRGGLTVKGGGKAIICSAGVAMGIVLNRVRCTQAEHSFIHSLIA